MDMDKNLQMLESYCDFSDLSAVYILLMLPRKKENVNQVEREKLDKRVRFIVKNMDDVKYALEEFDRYAKLYPEVIFRIYISVNRRSLMKGMITFQKKLLDFNKDLMNGNDQVWTPIATLGSEFKSVLAKKECKHDRNWMFDVDLPNDDEDACWLVKCFIKHLENITEVIYFGKSKSGFAIVVKPFNLNELIIIRDTELKKDSYLYVDCLNDSE